jgi:uncharacterized iron-regulated protein
VGLLSLLCLSAGCAHPSTTKVGSSHELAPEPTGEPHQKSEPEPEPVPPDIVERSALPFTAFSAVSDETLSEVELFDALASQDVVCVAEQHNNPHHHWAQLYIVQEMARRAHSSGRELGLGLEMFQTRFQADLDKYASDRIGASELLEQTEYEQRWGFDFAYYAPQVDHAVAQGASLLALNAPREQTKRVARDGYDALSAREQRLLGGFDLENEAHRELFDELMQDHPKGMGSMEHMYAAQVLWDETMAQTASAWLSERFPARQLIVLAGSAHCHESAIPTRILQRMNAKVVSVLPLLQKSSDTAQLEARLSGYDFGFVMHGE